MRPADLVRTTRPETYTYKGETTVIPDVTGDYCLACGEMLTDASESDRVMNQMLAFNKTVKG